MAAPALSVLLERSPASALYASAADSSSRSGAWIAGSAAGGLVLMPVPRLRRSMSMACLRSSARSLLRAAATVSVLCLGCVLEACRCC